MASTDLPENRTRLFPLGFSAPCQQLIGVKLGLIHLSDGLFGGFQVSCGLPPRDSGARQSARCHRPRYWTGQERPIHLPIIFCQSPTAFTVAGGAVLVPALVLGWRGCGLNKGNRKGCPCAALEVGWGKYGAELRTTRFASQVFLQAASFKDTTVSSRQLLLLPPKSLKPHYYLIISSRQLTPQYN